MFRVSFVERFYCNTQLQKNRNGESFEKENSTQKFPVYSNTCTCVVQGEHACVWEMEELVCLCGGAGEGCWVDGVWECLSQKKTHKAALCCVVVSSKKFVCLLTFVATLSLNPLNNVNADLKSPTYS